MDSNLNMYITLGVLAFSAAFFVWGKIRSDIVALCALLALMLTSVLTVEEALSGFSNSIVIMMAALFIVGGGIFQTGLAKMISTKILALAGKSEKKLFLLVMLVTALIGSFVSNTGTVALMLPIVISLAAAAKTDSKRLLMPLAFASSMGGMMTLIGTPPNLIISGTLEDAGYGALSFFSFLPVGIITLTVGVIILWPMSKMLISKDKDSDDNDSKEEKLSELSQKYQIAQNLYRLRVNASSPLNNKQLKDLDITARYNVTIAEIKRDEQKRFHKSVNVNMAGADSTIRENDLLYVLGKFDNVEHFAAENNIAMIDSHLEESKAMSVGETGGMDFNSIGIAELVLLSTSKIVNKQVKDSGFRNLYNVNILGIRRNDEYILQNLKDERMKAGDVLLIQGAWNDIHKLDQEEGDEWVVVGEPMKELEKVPITIKAPIAGAIMVAMVVVMATGWLPPVTAVLIAAVLMILTGCLRNVEAAYKTINWESIVLFAGMIPLSIAMDKTGASTLISGGIVSGLGQFGPIAVLAGIYLATSFLTLFLSNTATAVLFAPIALQSAISLDVNPMAFLFAVAVAASMCFASPFSTPPNALVMSAGRYKFMDYVKVGVPLQLIYAIIMVIALPLLFPF
ncbi:di/tricarboxylate transporter [Dysgonomonadaceae bacterium PH5-43]|nr:di/tricarboxylate transporter [Dysgonomonadaceae bacterium PH5-43]